MNRNEQLVKAFEKSSEISTRLDEAFENEDKRLIRSLILEAKENDGDILSLFRELDIQQLTSNNEEYRSV